MEIPGCCRAVAEPTEQEFNDALAEATQELQVGRSLSYPNHRTVVFVKIQGMVLWPLP